MRPPPKNQEQSYFQVNDGTTDFPTLWETQVKNKIRNRYARQLVVGGSLKKAESSMKELGYSNEMVELLPKELRRAFSGCGCPISALSLVGDEVLVDLGCGAGIDSFLASKLLGTGMIVSVDFSSHFLELLDGHIQNSPIQLVNGDIEHLPLDNGIADIVISNAAFNLTINKNAAYKETHRILKPGGKIVMSDLVCDKSLPREILEDPLAHTTSLGGVTNTSNIRSALKKAGFVQIEFVNRCQFSFVSAILIKAQKKNKDQ